MLYSLARGDSGKPALRSVALSSLAEAGWQEKDLENVLAQRIEVVLREDRLFVVAQERRWQEEADILALDETGVLHIFELKRSSSDESNLLQVMRYGQIFGQKGYDSLERRFRKYIGDPSVVMADRHQELFELDEPLAKRAFNHDQRFVVVTAGVDLPTLRGIEYWREKKLPISALTYHVYKVGGEFLLEFHGFSPKSDDYVALLNDNYIVNTNRTYNKNVYRDMLAQEKASAYSGRKTAVDEIKKGDRVFLYHTGVGVIACGRATDRARACDYQGEEDVEHFVKLKLDVKVDPTQEPDKCVAAWEINEAVGMSHRFRQTCFSIDSEMADKIEELLRKKNI